MLEKTALRTANDLQKRLTLQSECVRCRGELMSLGVDDRSPSAADASEIMEGCREWHGLTRTAEKQEAESGRRGVSTEVSKRSGLHHISSKQTPGNPYLGVMLNVLSGQLYTSD